VSHLSTNWSQIADFVCFRLDVLLVALRNRLAYAGAIGCFWGPSEGAGTTVGESIAVTRSPRSWARAEPPNALRPGNDPGARSSSATDDRERALKAPPSAARAIARICIADVFGFAIAPCNWIGPIELTMAQSGSATGAAARRVVSKSVPQTAVRTGLVAPAAR
jgi:hypothetical protein